VNAEKVTGKAPKAEKRPVGVRNVREGWTLSYLFTSHVVVVQFAEVARASRPWITRKMRVPHSNCAITGLVVGEHLHAPGWGRLSICRLRKIAGKGIQFWLLRAESVVSDTW